MIVKCIVVKVGLFLVIAGALMYPESVLANNSAMATTTGGASLFNLRTVLYDYVFQILTIAGALAAVAYFMGSIKMIIAVVLGTGFLFAVPSLLDGIRSVLGY